jgi:hypothetical protein
MDKIRCLGSIFSLIEPKIGAVIVANAVLGFLTFLFRLVLLCRNQSRLATLSYVRRLAVL